LFQKGTFQIECYEGIQGSVITQQRRPSEYRPGLLEEIIVNSQTVTEGKYEYNSDVALGLYLLLTEELTRLGILPAEKV